MFKNSIKLLIVSSITITTLFFSLFTTPYVSATDNQVGFYVSAVIPDNQMDKNASYFDLKVNPNQEQILEIQIFNEQAQDLVVDISAISASTNRNGIVDYTTPDIQDETLVYPFSELATPQEGTVTIPANSVKSIYVDVILPNEYFDGVILGGVVITKDIEHNQVNETDNSTSISIQNNYSYVIGVKLNQTEVEVKPNFDLVNIETDAVNSYAAIVHNLRNTEAYIVKNLDLDLTITNLNTNTTYLETSKTIDMAPNSIFPFTVYPEKAVLEEGSYSSRLVVTLDEQEWVFQKEFIIESKEANVVNSQIPKEHNNNWFVILIIVLLIIIILLLLIILLRRKKDDEEKSKK